MGAPGACSFPRGSPLLSVDRHQCPGYIHTLTFCRYSLRPSAHKVRDAASVRNQAHVLTLFTWCTAPTPFLLIVLFQPAPHLEQRYNEGDRIHLPHALRAYDQLFSVRCGGYNYNDFALFVPETLVAPAQPCLEFVQM